MKSNLRQNVIRALAARAMTFGQLVDALPDYHPAYVVAEAKKLIKKGHARHDSPGLLQLTADPKVM